RRAGSDIWRRRRRASSEVGAELLRVCGVFARIEDKGGESFRVGRERATQDGLVNEIDTEPRSVISDVASDIVTQLVLFLIPKNGKRGDGGDELLVAERFETGSGGRGGTEGKGERETKIGIARLREMEKARAENECANPGRSEGVLIAESQIQVVVVRGGSGGRQSSLLNERVVSGVAIGRSSEEPSR